MPTTLVNPPGLATPPDLYHTMSITTASRLVFLAGQVAVNADGNLVGDGDLAAQLEQCYANIGTALAEIGATFADVVKVTIYAVEWTPDKFPQLEEGIARGSSRLGIESARPPGTLVGVAALAAPDYLVEVEVIAAID